MYLAKYGSGEQVIIGFHGWSGDHTTFDPLVQYLPRNVTFYSLDLPGSGRSVAPQRWDMDVVSGEIAQEIMALTAAKFTFVGSCSGGLFSLFVAKYLQATRQIDKLSRVVLIDPFAYLPWYFKVFVARQMGKIGWYAYYTTFANPIGRWIANLSLHKHRTEEVDLTSSFAAVNHQATYHQLRMLAESGGATQFRGLPMSVEILYGEKTFRAVRTSVQQWRQVLPQARCYELKGAGHLPLTETTAQVAAILFGTTGSKYL